jgi:hypothetical protein
MTVTTMVVVVSGMAFLAYGGVAAASVQNATPKKWVATFCKSGLTWENTLKSGLVKLKATLVKYQDGDIGLPAVKNSVIAFIDNLVEASDKVVKQLKKVGAPAVPNGDKIQKGELAAFGKAKSVFRAAKKMAQALSTGDTQKFGEGLTAVGHKITLAGHKISAAESKLHKYSSKALKDAARHQAVCSKVPSFLP